MGKIVFLCMLFGGGVGKMPEARLAKRCMGFFGNSGRFLLLRVCAFFVDGIGLRRSRKN